MLVADVAQALQEAVFGNEVAALALDRLDDDGRDLVGRGQLVEQVAQFLLDALAAIDTETVEIGLTDANSSCLIRSPGTTNARYVVMPMRL